MVSNLDFHISIRILGEKKIKQFYMTNIIVLKPLFFAYFGCKASEKRHKTRKTPKKTNQDFQSVEKKIIICLFCHMTFVNY